MQHGGDLLSARGFREGSGVPLCALLRLPVPGARDGRLLVVGRLPVRGPGRRGGLGARVGFASVRGPGRPGAREGVSFPAL